MRQKSSSLSRICLMLAIFMLVWTKSYSQRYLSDYDSTLFMKDTVRPLVKRFENLLISGYIQPQFQLAQKSGVQSFEGGNFSEHSNSRFMLRRARVRVDYRMPGKAGDFPAALFTFQIEATERDVNVRDMYVRIYEPKKNNFSFTMGLVARPYGYEVNLSSSFREAPERGRASQTLMPSERDLGAMITYDVQKPKTKRPQLKLDVGLFNGEGKSGPAEFDSYKDLIGRLTMKPYALSKKMSVSGGLSYLNGGWYQATKYEYTMDEQNGKKLFVVDSSLDNIGAKAPRQYYGADGQFVLKHGWGKTEWRAEYWRGKQPGTALTTVNPGTLPTGPTFIREFDAAFFYFLQNIINSKWELIAKFDWYDPNTKAKGKEIGVTNLTAADIKYSTLGIGLTRYFTSNLKILAYYAIVKNEETSLAGYTQDLKDDVLTLRMQFRF